MCHEEVINYKEKGRTYLWYDKVVCELDNIFCEKIVSKECLRHAISTYEKYEKIIKEHGLVNGEVEISIEIIKEIYHKKFKEKF